MPRLPNAASQRRMETRMNPKQKATMKKLAVITIAALLSSGCITRIVEVEESESTNVQTTRPSTTVASTTTVAPTTTKPPATTPPQTISAQDTDNLDYITGFCYTDCTRQMEATWERFLKLSTPNGLAAAVGAMATLSYSEIDELCTTFWSQTDSSLVTDAINNYDITDTNAMMATYYYVCDS